MAPTLLTVHTGTHARVYSRFIQHLKNIFQNINMFIFLTITFQRQEKWMVETLAGLVHIKLSPRPLLFSAKVNET